MKRTILSSLAVSALIIAACNTTKKSTATPPATTSTVVTTTTATTTDAPPAATEPAVMGPSMPARPGKGVIEPGTNELTAIQATYKDVTAQTLTDGYLLYTGVCTNCHGAKNIYRFREEEWVSIMDDMAPKAQLTAVQKDAVYKYVLAVKATQPK